MRILIVGAGNTGRHLAAKLCEMAHEVIVIDCAPEPLAALDAQLDVMTVLGSGASPDVLEKAELTKADLLIAVTDSDEVNILACVFARAAGVPHKVARVANPALIHSTLVDFKRLGVDCMVSQNEQTARELFDILRNPGLLESTDLLGGRVLIVRISVVAASPLNGTALSDFGQMREEPDSTAPPAVDAATPHPKRMVRHKGPAEVIARVRFIAGMRDESVCLPRGDTRFEAGDDVYVAVQPQDLHDFLDWVYPNRQAFEKNVIAGGGSLGLGLVMRLEAESIPSVLLEQDAIRAGTCSDVLRKATVLHGDASDQETLVNAGVGPNMAFVAVTGDEELNIISCMLAHKLGAAFTIALVSKPQYVPVVRQLGMLSRVVSPYLAMTNEILHFVRGKHVKAAVRLNRSPGELLHVIVGRKHRWVGKPISRLKMPGACLLATVLRDDRIHVPTGDLAIQAGDQLVIFALPDVVGRVQNLFRT
jgi:trk system potassium uptake protein